MATLLNVPGKQPARAGTPPKHRRACEGSEPQKPPTKRVAITNTQQCFSHAQLRRARPEPNTQRVFTARIWEFCVSAVRGVGCSGRDFGVSSSPYGRLRVGQRDAFGAHSRPGRSTELPSKFRATPRNPEDNRPAVRQEGVSTISKKERKDPRLQRLVSVAVRRSSPARSPVRRSTYPAPDSVLGSTRGAEAEGRCLEKRGGSISSRRPRARNVCLGISGCRPELGGRLCRPANTALVREARVPTRSRP